MNTIPTTAQQLLDRQADLNLKLDSLHNIIDKTKAPEWIQAKTMYNVYFSALREINMKLNKIRKAVGYEVVNGKRVTIYQYK